MVGVKEVVTSHLFRPRAWQKLTIALCLWKTSTTTLASMFQTYQILHSIVVDAKLPDHSVLSWQVKVDLSMVAYNAPSQTNLRKVVRKIPNGYMASETCIGKFNELHDLLDSSLFSREMLSTMYQKFCATVESELITRRVKVKSKFSKPWWSLELGWLKRELKDALTNWQRDKSDLTLKLRYTHTQRQFDREVKYAKRSFVSKQQQEFTQAIKINPRQFWRDYRSIEIRGNAKSTKLPQSVLNSEGTVIEGKHEVIQCWGQYFSKLLNGHAPISPPSARDTLYIPPISPSCEDLNSPISLEEVKTAIMRLKSKKAPGPDQIRADYLKNDLCISLLHSLFNRCFEKGSVPSQWNQSTILPIPKGSGVELDPQNYRGISLQPIVLKGLASILGNRLSNWVEDHDILAEEQCGFRKERECMDHIFTLNGIVEARMAQGKETFVCFIDLRKSFDSVDRKLLWHKLQKFYGLEGKIINILRAMYEEVESSVRVNDDLSEWFSVEKGVKQGCILSPLLFGLFINDLPSYLKGQFTGVRCGECDIGCLLYADDIALLSDSEENLQVALNLVYNWCCLWGFQINPKISQIMHFRLRRRRISNYQFTCGNNPLRSSV